jgi:hypothetical protein
MNLGASAGGIISSRAIRHFEEHSLTFLSFFHGQTTLCIITAFAFPVFRHRI